MAPGMAIGSSAQRSSASWSTAGTVTTSTLRAAVLLGDGGVEVGRRLDDRHQPLELEEVDDQPDGAVAARADHLHLDAGRAGLLGGAHQAPCAGGVEEPGGGQVDDEGAWRRGDLDLDGGDKLGHGGQVELTPYGERRAPRDRRPLYL